MDLNANAFLNELVDRGISLASSTNAKEIGYLAMIYELLNGRGALENVYKERSDKESWLADEAQTLYDDLSSQIVLGDDYPTGKNVSEIMTYEEIKPKTPFKWVRFRTYPQAGWFFANENKLTLGVAPSSWTDGSYRAYQIKYDPEYLRTTFTNKGYADKNAMIGCEIWRSYSSTDGGMIMSWFRVKNNSDSSIIWPIHMYFCSYPSWGEYASAAIQHDADLYEDKTPLALWDYTTDIGDGNANFNVYVSPKREVDGKVFDTSSVIFISPSGPPYSSDASRHSQLGFYNNCLDLPEGLEYIDDYDTVESFKYPSGQY